MKTFDPNTAGIQYDVNVPGFVRPQDIMDVQTYKEGVESCFFMNCDGSGEFLDADLSPVGVAHPSEIDYMPQSAVWVVWYNK